MRLLRILLQLLILAFFLPILFLIAVQRPLEVGALLAASGLFILLLLLILLLREHTAHRRDHRHDISDKVMLGFVFLAGGALLLFAGLIASGQYQPNGRRGQLLTGIIELIGPWLPAGVFLALGLQLVWLGY